MTYASRVAHATADPEWQKFRESLKGLSTKQKLVKLREYYNDQEHVLKSHAGDCAVCIRVDNYLKALARGGQLERGVNIDTARLVNFNLKIRK